MKVLAIIALTGLLIGICVAGYGVIETEPEMFIWAGILAGFGIAPFVLVSIVNAVVATGRGIRSATSLAESKAKQLIAETAAAKAEAEARKQIAVRQKELAVELAEKKAAVEYLKSDLGREISTPQTLPNKSVTHNPAFDSLAQKPVRVAISVIALFVFLFMPQFKMFISFNGFTIAKTTIVGMPDLSKMDNPFEFSKNENNTPQKPARTPMGLDLVLVVWIMIIGLFASIYGAIKDNIKLEFNSTLTCLITAVITFILMEIRLSTTGADESNPFIQGIKAMIGFESGFHFLLLILVAHVALAWIEKSNLKGVPRPA